MLSMFIHISLLLLFCIFAISDFSFVSVLCADLHHKKQQKNNSNSLLFLIHKQSAQSKGKQQGTEEKTKKER